MKDEFDDPPAVKPKHPSRDELLAMFPGLQADIDFLRGLFGDFKILELKSDDQHLNTKLNIEIEKRASLNVDEYLRLGTLGKFNAVEQKGRKK